jgi:hypothetical protein
MKISGTYDYQTNLDGDFQQVANGFEITQLAPTRYQLKMTDEDGEQEVAMVDACQFGDRVYLEQFDEEDGALMMSITRKNDRELTFHYLGLDYNTPGTSVYNGMTVTQWPLGELFPLYTVDNSPFTSEQYVAKLDQMIEVNLSN